MNRIDSKGRGGVLTTVVLLMFLVGAILYFGETRLGWNVARQLSLQNSEEGATKSSELADPHTLTLGGREVTLKNASYLRNGIVMVPMRETFEAADATVSYDAESDRAIATTGDTKVFLSPGSRHALIGRNAYRMIQPSEVKDGALYVPLAMVEKALLVEVAATESEDI